MGARWGLQKMKPHTRPRSRACAARGLSFPRRRAGSARRAAGRFVWPPRQWPGRCPPAPPGGFFFFWGGGGRPGREFCSRPARAPRPRAAAPERLPGTPGGGKLASLHRAPSPATRRRGGRRGGRGRAPDGAGRGALLAGVGEGFPVVLSGVAVAAWNAHCQIQPHPTPSHSF